MHAVVGTVKIDDYETARKYLTENVIPGVKQAPGFVSGTWVAPAEDGRGLSVVVFESEEAAKAAQERMQAMADEAPVTIESVQIREVSGRA